MATRIDDTVLPKNFYSYCCACIDMERHGLDCFDEDGNYGERNGEMIITKTLIVFQQVELYEECAFLRDLLIKYKDKFHSAPEPIAGC
ncbi:MAG: hypothetical protein U0T74_15075 [Chitinophagales bacterium]